MNIDWNNLQEEWHVQFVIDDKAFTGGEYDYESIMHYPGYHRGLAVNGNLPLMTATTRCGSNCPKLGEKPGLSRLDHEQLRLMYKCPASLTATWTKEMHCIDSPIQEKKLPCAQYVA